MTINPLNIMTSDNACSDHLPKILIAEDVAVNMLLAKTICRVILPNAIILEASNGREALRIFKENSPDLVLMDVKMPELDGCEATGAIRKLEKNSRVPIIGVSAGILNSERELCISSGMDDYLYKPIFKDSLEFIFKKWLPKPDTALNTGHK